MNQDAQTTDLQPPEVSSDGADSQPEVSGTEVSAAPFVVAFTGRAGAGKDTAASALIAFGAERVAFADAIKDGLAAMFGVPRNWFDDREFKERVVPWLGKSPRQLAQLCGTEFGRNMIAEDVWLRVARHRIERSLAPVVVIPDVRFENEASLVRSLGGHVIHVTRADALQVSSHISEAGVKVAPVDSQIENHGTVGELHAAVLRIALQQMGERVRGGE